MKKWMALMVAVGFILTASVSAQADSVLLPWIVKDKSISTLVSVINAYDPSYEGKKVRLHFVYWYKKTTKNEQTESCEEVDFCVPTSFNDIILFDAAGNFKGGSPIFEDSVQGEKYTTVQGTSLALPVEGPRRAYLIITNEVYKSEVCGAAPVAGFEDSIYAEAMVVDIANGAAWGYDGYNPRNPVTAGMLTPQWGDFTDNVTGIPTDQLGQIVASKVIGDPNRKEFAFLTIMPPNSGITTKLFVTPIGDKMITKGDYEVTSKLFCSLPDASDIFQEDDTRIYQTPLGGIFDYDERCISFETTKTVKCTDASGIEHYISSGAWTIFKNSNAEGWAYLFLTGGTQQAAIGKLEYSIGAANFGGSRIGAAINNFVWVRGRTGTAGQ